MNALLVTLGTLGLLSLSAQLLRHAFVGVLAPNASVLDKYEDTTKKDLVGAHSLDELLHQYEKNRRNVTEWERGKTQGDIDNARFAEPYLTEEKLKSAIQVLERRANEITELHFYWWSGMLCLILGLSCFLYVNRWLGIAVLAIGFVEMIYWTSPSGIMAGGAELAHLLTWKLIYTAVSLALLFGLWWFFVRHSQRRAET